MLSLAGDNPVFGGWVDQMVASFKGASLPDPKGLFNAELGGTTRRAIKFVEGDRINEAPLKEPVRAGVTLNETKPAGKSSRAKSLLKQRTGIPR